MESQEDKIARLEFQIEVLEHNIDLLDSNYQYLLNDLSCDELDRVSNYLLKLPDSLKPTIEFPEFKIIPADEGQELGSRQIPLSKIS